MDRNTTDPFEGIETALLLPNMPPLTYNRNTTDPFEGIETLRFSYITPKLQRYNRNTTDPFEGIETVSPDPGFAPPPLIETPLTRLRGLRPSCSRTTLFWQ